MFNLTVWQPLTAKQRRTFVTAPIAAHLCRVAIGDRRVMKVLFFYRKAG
jgi:hypothetical protein